MDAPRLPNSSQRLAVCGRTGTGKTVGGLYHISRKDLRRESWVILNFKEDELINSIARARHIEYDWKPPRKGGGVYVLHPSPHETEQVEAFLWRLWENENVGVFADEGYMLSRSSALEALLTQGRSKHIPLIICTQRPVWVSRFVFSEADFLQVFDLTDKRDWQTVEQVMPRVEDMPLQQFHSWYYDVARKQLFEFTPVPEPRIIVNEIDSQLFTRKI